jgi:predicted RNA-binding Zn-ribbon protein involved in translation (DUF1610 family)
MPTLIVEEPGRRFGGRINGRVLIGRLPTNGVALTDSSVSRLHAWIDHRDGEYYVADTGSLTGTWVNTQPIEKRKDLTDGDVVRVGQTQISFHRDDSLPDGLQTVDLDGQAPSPNVIDAGVLFDCVCGAPIWFKSTAIGHAHQCRHCGRTVRIPEHSGVAAEDITPVPKEPPLVAHALHSQSADDPMLLHGSAHELERHVDEHGVTDLPLPSADLSELPPLEERAEPESDLTLEQAVSPGDEVAFPGPQTVSDFAAEPEAKPPLFQPKQKIAPAQVCSVCHSPIVAGETTTVCPSCGLTFHAECWQANQGCSAYGCPQVGALAPKQEEPADDHAEVGLAELQEAPEIAETPSAFPWEFLFLLVAVLGAVIGARSYGVPSFIGVIGTLIYLVVMQNAPKRRPIVWLALLIGLIGIGAGLYVSKFWWGGWPPIGPWMRHGR